MLTSTFLSKSIEKQNNKDKKLTIENDWYTLHCGFCYDFCYYNDGFEYLFKGFHYCWHFIDGVFYETSLYFLPVNRWYYDWDGENWHIGMPQQGFSIWFTHTHSNQ